MLADLEPPYVVIKPGVREDEFYALGEDSDWEYLDGRLVMSPASRRHETLFRFLLTLLGSYLDERRHLLTPQRLEGPADWVVEIASEGDPAFDAREKLPRYREAGIPEIWLIDPFTETIAVERKAGIGYERADLSAGRLESTVVPGFWIEVDWLWRDDLPSTLSCLREILGSL